MLSIHFILNGVNCVANLQISVWLLTVAFCCCLFAGEDAGQGHIQSAFPCSTGRSTRRRCQVMRSRQTVGGGL